MAGKNCSVIFDSMSLSLVKNLLLPPNLISLYRVFILPIIGYYLAQPDYNSMLIAVTLMFSAGISDALDGYVARKLNMISDFGIAFDPVCDKIFAAVIVILMIFYRDFPLWLVGVIIGRDILILIAGSLLLKDKKIIVPSNLTGKYAFASIALLLGSYSIWFDFGIKSMTFLSVIFTLFSIIVYFRVYQAVRQGKEPPKFKDNVITKYGRIGLSAIFLLYFIYRLFLFMYE